MVTRRYNRLGRTARNFSRSASARFRHFCWRCGSNRTGLSAPLSGLPLTSRRGKRRRVAADNLLSRDDKRSRRTDINQDVVGRSTTSRTWNRSSPCGVIRASPAPSSLSSTGSSDPAGSEPAPPPAPCCGRTSAGPSATRRSRLDRRAGARSQTRPGRTGNRATRATGRSRRSRRAPSAVPRASTAGFCRWRSAKAARSPSAHRYSISTCLRSGLPLAPLRRRRLGRHPITGLLLQQPHRFLDGALELRIVAGDHVLRPVLDVDVGRRRLRSRPPTCRRA